MPQETRKFVYRSVMHTVVLWYLEGQETMASNMVIVERIAESGSPPPKFARFMAEGSTEVETVLGPQNIGYGIPIYAAETVDEAVTMLKEADKAVLPEVIAAAKEQAMEEYKRVTSKIALPRGMPNPPPGAIGPAAKLFKLFKP